MNLQLDVRVSCSTKLEELSSCTFAFSNPVAKHNKLGVGIETGIKVWENMDSHLYEDFLITLAVNSGRTGLNFKCKCTEGHTNVATVEIVRV